MVGRPLALFRAVLDCLVPPRCVICGAVVCGDDGLCADCFPKLTLISEPMCKVCGLPFEYGGGLCNRCAHKAPPFARHVSATRYSDAAKKIILPFKHADETRLARFMARLMAAAGAGLLRRADLLVPVPLSRRRLWKRLYNQSGLIAGFLARASGKPASYTNLKRIRWKASQGHLSRTARRENVRGAFALSDRAEVKGRKILLVDDVYTTGATLSECARVLLAAGAAEVCCLTFARAGGGSPSGIE